MNKIPKSRILGSNKMYYPVQEGEHMIKRVRITTVLVGRQEGQKPAWDCACYSGVGSEDWIRANGIKCTFKEANIQFPGLKEHQYRK